MQASAVYASSPHPLYPSPYHPVLSGPQDHELKKQYLALLPPQQIIDICLNFDLHVPPYVKSSIWPADINAAIAAMRKASPPPTGVPAAPVASTFATGSLATSSDPSAAADKSIEKPTEAQPPDKPSPTPDPAASAQTSVQPSPASEQPPAAPVPVPAQQPPYPHQPYGYGHPQAAYPHAPYYQPPPGYPPYPSPYPYPQMPTTYPHQPPPGYPQQLNPPFTTAPLTHPQQQPPDAFNPNPTPTEDLPSYEEMIVEALLDSGDPEGCAPKDLFTWMASRYPLQQNFRPSASQALQKAFKRGRFQKSSGGKYRLNATWEGGNTSRRTTRRPQTQNPPAPAPAATSPFTHAPLVHHHPQPGAQTGFQPQGFNYSFQQQGYPGFQQQAQSQPQTAAAAGTSTGAAAAVTAGDAGRPPAGDGAAHDAWEAAQNILKAINFDSLLQLPKEDDKSAAEHDREPAAASSSAAPSAPVTAAPTMDFLTAALSGVDAHAGTGTGGGTGGGAEVLDANVAAGRAELQAQLALLAAQLAEISQEDEGDPVVHYPVVGVPPPPAPTPAPATATVAPASHALPPFTPPLVAAEHNPVPPPQVPMGSLLPDAGFALPGPKATVVQPPLQAPPPPPPPIVPQPVTAEPEEEEDSEDDDDMEEVI